MSDENPNVERVQSAGDVAHEGEPGSVRKPASWPAPPAKFETPPTDISKDEIADILGDTEFPKEPVVAEAEPPKSKVKRTRKKVEAVEPAPETVQVKVVERVPDVSLRLPMSEKTKAEIETGKRVLEKYKK